MHLKSNGRRPKSLAGSPTRETRMECQVLCFRLAQSGLAQPFGDGINSGMHLPPRLSAFQIKQTFTRNASIHMTTIKEKNSDDHNSKQHRLQTPTAGRQDDRATWPTEQGGMLCQVRPLLGRPTSRIRRPQRTAQVLGSLPPTDSGCLWAPASPGPILATMNTRGGAQQRRGEHSSVWDSFLLLVKLT